MNIWNRFDVHLENLVPGLAVLCAYLPFHKAYSIQWLEIPEGWSQYPAMLGIALVGAGYMVGVVVNVAGRFLFDTVSEWTARPPMLKALAWRKAPEIAKLRTSQFRAINDVYDKYINEAITCGDESIAGEVAKRRQTGRLLRSAYFPICVLLAVVFRAPPLLNWTFLRPFAITYCVMLLLYAYSEVTVFHEAYQGHKKLRWLYYG